MYCVLVFPVSFTFIAVIAVIVLLCVYTFKYIFTYYFKIEI